MEALVVRYSPHVDHSNKLTCAWAKGKSCQQTFLLNFYLTLFYLAQLRTICLTKVTCRNTLSM